MNAFATMAEKIIEKQESIIGPIALEQARKVSGLSIDWTKHEVVIKGKEQSVIDELVKQYEHIFGKASVEACKEAIKGVISQIPQDQVPSLLK